MAIIYNIKCAWFFIDFRPTHTNIIQHNHVFVYRNGGKFLHDFGCNHYCVVGQLLFYSAVDSGNARARACALIEYAHTFSNDP